MYAIIEDSGKQFRVHENDVIEVDTRPLKEGAKKIEFDRVMLLGDEDTKTAPKVGQPWIDGAKVIGRIDGEAKGNKILVVKLKRRKGYHRTKGHRQRFLRVTIEKIQG